MSVNLSATHDTTVLLVEDHADAAATIGAHLEALGYAVDYAPDSQTAVNLIATCDYDGIILDLDTANLDGIKMYQRIRDHYQQLPVIVITTQLQACIASQLDADNAAGYLYKPLNLRQLTTHISQMIHRTRESSPRQCLRVHDLIYDPLTGAVNRNGHTVSVSPLARRILNILMRESPKLVSRDKLKQELWGDAPPDTDTLRSHFYNLRKAIDRPYAIKLLHTVQGMGFKLAHPDDL